MYCLLLSSMYRLDVMYFGKKLLLSMFYLSHIFFEKVMFIIHDNKYFDHLIYILASCLFEISTCYSVFFFVIFLLNCIVIKQFASNAFMKDFFIGLHIFLVLCQILWKLMDTE